MLARTHTSTVDLSPVLVAHAHTHVSRGETLFGQTHSSTLLSCQPPPPPHASPRNLIHTKEHGRRRKTGPLHRTWMAFVRRSMDPKCNELGRPPHTTTTTTTPSGERLPRAVASLLVGQYNNYFVIPSTTRRRRCRSLVPFRQNSKHFPVSRFPTHFAKLLFRNASSNTEKRTKAGSPRSVGGAAKHFT